MKQLAVLSLVFAGLAGTANAGIPTSGRKGDLAYRPRTKAEVDDDKTPRGATPLIIYLDMEGGTWSPGPDNGSNHTSSILQATSTFTPFQQPNPEKQKALLLCTQRLFGRFNLEVTDVDPQATPHITAIVTGGTSFEAGLSSSILGISPFSCDVIPTSVVYIFGAFYGNDVQETCETVGQETAHSFGLEHEALCEDPMTYTAGCHPKTFQNIDARCGEYEDRPEADGGPRDCDCTGAPTQNSVAMMTDRLGPAETILPTVSITAPMDGASIDGGFLVQANASDNYVLDKVEFQLDGSTIGTDEVAPYEFSISKKTMPGMHMVSAKAFDVGQNTSTATIMVNVTAACSTNEECVGDEICDVYYCASDLGGVCENQDDCAGSNSCGADGLCTRPCSPSSDDCPDGFHCEDNGFGGGSCMAGGGGGGGCACAVSSTFPGSDILGLSAVALGACLLVIIRVRRRTR